MAAKGFQLVYGSTANLFTDRHGEYIGYGPEAAELVGMPEPETFEVLPWDPQGRPRLVHVLPQPRGAREPGLVPHLRLSRQPEADPGRVRAGDRAPPPRGHRARDDVAEPEGGRHARHQRRHEAVLLPHRPVQRAAADHPQGGRVRAGARARHDPGRPRGRARPDRAQLQLRPRRADRRQPLDLPPGLPAGRPRARRFPCFMPKPFMGVSANGCHHNISLWRGDENAFMPETDDQRLPSQLGL